MTHDERGRTAGNAVRRLCVLAVLAPLSVAATTGLLRPGPPPVTSVSLGVQSASAAEVQPVRPVPDVPDQIDVPASVTTGTSRDTAGLGVVTDARFAAVDAIPGRALTAYQRAETVLHSADPSCHVSWQLIAAIGKVESNHGRYGGALMTADGVVHPAIYGPQLSGRHATSRVADTDAGLLDGDTRFDRAVGPMQFIPSTWTVVGVDADGDGRRDPQDIDDASLATAVYLCSGDADLATRAGQRSAVHRYNHSKAYVDLVIRVMAGYLHADPGLFSVIGGPGFVTTLPPAGPGYTPIPGTPQPTFEVLPTDGPSGSPSATASPSATPTHKPTGKPSGEPTDRPPTPEPTAGPTSGPTSGPTTATTGPTAGPTTAAPTSGATGEPTGGPTAGPTSGPTEGPTSPPPSDDPTDDPTGTPTADPTGTPTDAPGDPGEPGDSGDPVVPQQLLDAWTACVDAGVDAADLGAMTTCLVDQTGLPEDDAVLQWLLAHPPATPPATRTQTQQRRRRRPSA